MTPLQELMNHLKTLGIGVAYIVIIGVGAMVVWGIALLVARYGWLQNLGLVVLVLAVAYVLGLAHRLGHP